MRGSSSTPRSKPCPHCGRELKARTADLRGVRMFCGFEPCGCEGELAAAKAEEESERKRREAQLRRARVSAGVPSRYADAVRPEAAAYAEKVAQGRGMYLVGPVGTGKTHLASAVCRELQRMGKGFRMLSSVQLLERYRACFDGQATESSVTQGLCGVPVLVIDDLGKESPTDWAVERLFRVIDDRYNRERPVIVTTQFERPALIRRLSRGGDSENAVALVSRLCEMCGTVRTDGADKRLA